jgi:plastocyanin
MRIHGYPTVAVALMLLLVCGHGVDEASGDPQPGVQEQRRTENGPPAVPPSLRRNNSQDSDPSASRPANGAIRGRVELKQPLARTAPRTNVTDLGMPAMHAPIDRRSVVYLDPAPRAAFDTREEPRPRMDQRNETFFPHVLAIVAGTTVDFPNNDETYHNVFSLSKTKSFDLGRYAVGRTKAVRFDRPGIVRVFCDIHSHMSAFILVFSHRYFAVADGEGRYRLDNVPPGIYTVVAWNEAAPLESRQAVIPESGGDVEINFALGRR